MGIFDRMGKVISSNVNALFDRLEDPKKLLELDLDEAGDQLRRGRQELVTAVGEEKRLKKKVDELDADVARWEKRAELAVKSSDEALAREAIQKKRKVQEDRERTEKARMEQRDTALRMKEELEKAEKRLEEWKMRKGTIAAKAQQSKAGGGVEALGARGGSSALSELRRLEERIEGRELESSAMTEVEEALGTGPSKEDLEAKFRDLEAKVGKGSAASAEVEEELAAIKKRVRV
jgi:phage shock protein A